MTCRPRLRLLFVLLAASLAACAGNEQVYPQPYIAKAGPLGVTPQSTAAFNARTIVRPPRSKVRGLAEAYIASAVPHPSSVQFAGEFESNGRSIALCGFVKYRDDAGQMTGWHPFVVEWTRHSAKGMTPPFNYDADAELAKLCGPMMPPAG